MTIRSRKVRPHTEPLNHERFETMFRKEVKGGPRFLIRSTHPNVVLYGVFETPISKDSLEKAVRSCSGKHHLLNCHLHTDKDDKVWYVIDDSLPPDIHMPISNTLDEILANELEHIFDLENGPMIRFALLNREETTLVINCHHAICDGMSLVYLFKDIVKILSGEAVETSRNTPVFLEPVNIPQKLGNPFSRFFIGLINRKWSKMPIRFSNGSYLELHNKFWKKYNPRMIRFKFSEEKTANLISQCKQNKVSVNSGLVAAILRAENRVFGKKANSSKVIVTDNLRTHLLDRPGESMGYFVSTLRPNLDYNEKISFWENARCFHERIQRLLKKDLLKNQLVGLFCPEFLDVVMLNLFGQREDNLAKYLINKVGMKDHSATFAIANLGRISPDTASEKLKLKSIFGPMAVSDAMEKYISVLTINDELHFTICFNETHVDRTSILDVVRLMPEVFEEGPGSL